jgi:hypothetical protein
MEPGYKVVTFRGSVASHDGAGQDLCCSCRETFEPRFALRGIACPGGKLTCRGAIDFTCLSKCGFCSGMFVLGLVQPRLNPQDLVVDDQATLMYVTLIGTGFSSPQAVCLAGAGP